MTELTHKVVAVMAANRRWRINCRCGWKGPLVALPGHGFVPWSEHYYEATGCSHGTRSPETEVSR